VHHVEALLDTLPEAVVRLIVADAGERR